MTDVLLPGPGQIIADARQRSGISLDELCQSTRLRRGLLEQMEGDDFSDTGGDVYARGHLRTIAVILDLDPDELLEAYATVPSVRRPPAP